jgi:hypothetical protein
LSLSNLLSSPKFLVTVQVCCHCPICCHCTKLFPLSRLLSLSNLLSMSKFLVTVQVCCHCPICSHCTKFFPLSRFCCHCPICCHCPSFWSLSKIVVIVRAKFKTTESFFVHIVCLELPVKIKTTCHSRYLKPPVFHILKT